MNFKKNIYTQCTSISLIMKDHVSHTCYDTFFGRPHKPWRHDGHNTGLLTPHYVPCIEYRETRSVLTSRLSDPF